MNTKKLMLGLVGGLLLTTSALAGIKRGGTLYITKDAPMRETPTGKDIATLPARQPVVWQHSFPADKAWHVVTATLQGKQVEGVVWVKNLDPVQPAQFLYASKDGTPLDIHALASSSSATRAFTEDVASDGSPTGATNPVEQLQEAVALARKVTPADVQKHIKDRKLEDGGI